MVDPIALRQKLAKRQIGPKYPGSMANAVQAVHERELAVLGIRDPETHELQPTAPMGILSQEELAYCLNSFAAQWEIPA